MARERFVTRTIIGARVSAMVCDTTTGSVEVREYILTGKVDDSNALKMVQKLYQTPDLVICKVLSIETTEQLYGMPEVDFLKYAKPMPKGYFSKPEQD